MAMHVQKWLHCESTCHLFAELLLLKHYTFTENTNEGRVPFVNTASKRLPYIVKFQHVKNLANLALRLICIFNYPYFSE